MEPAEEPGSQGSRLVERLRISIGDLNFVARLEMEKVPLTCNIFKALLPFRNKAIHSRWSCEAVRAPLGDFEFGIGSENHASHPSRGDVLLYLGGNSETELLFAYGSSSFASKMGALAGPFPDRHRGPGTTRGNGSPCPIERYQANQLRSDGLNTLSRGL